MNSNNRSGLKSGRLSRRGFLKTGVSGGVAAALAALPGTAGAQALPSSASVPDFELDEITIDGLRERMDSGKDTARSIVGKYAARIEAVDRGGPSLRSVIEMNPDAAAIADGLDRERAEKRSRGPLHGIPILIKDNIDTADRMATTAGSLALVGSKPPEDAFVVRKLRDVGAVILGKTNLSEWANIRSNRSTSGWSGRGGLTRNPYALDRNTSGSSSGSAAAVAAGLCAVAVGTETDGSIVSPSSLNGIVGIKPTVGLVSRRGIIPIAHSQDTAGPMARTVRDAALLLGAMAGADPADPATARAPRGPVDYTKALDPEGLRGARIGIARRRFGFNPDVDAIMDRAIGVLRQRGAVLVDPADEGNGERFGDAEFTVLLYELKADLNAYLKRLGPGAPVHSLKEIIDFNERHGKEEMPYFGQENFLSAEAKGPLTSPEYLEALEKCRRLAGKEGIDALMDKHRLDAVLAPTGGPAWLTDLVNGDHFSGGSSSAAAVAGYPNITLPAGFVFGLPVGLSFFGRAWSESVLIRIAYAFEQATLVRKPPRFLPTADLRIGG